MDIIKSFLNMFMDIIKSFFNRKLEKKIDEYSNKIAIKKGIVSAGKFMRGIWSDDQRRVIYSKENMQQLAERLCNERIENWKGIIEQFLRIRYREAGLSDRVYKGDEKRFWEMVYKTMQDVYSTEANIAAFAKMDFEKQNGRSDVNQNSQTQVKWETWHYNTIKVNEEVMKNRSQEIQEVKGMIAANSYVAITGDPGMGKTVFAKSLVNGYKKVIWLDYKDTLQNTILLLGKVLNIYEELKELSDEKKYERICCELRGCDCSDQEQIYIVIDNWNGLQCFDKHDTNVFMNEFTEFRDNVIQKSTIKFIITTINAFKQKNVECFNMGALNDYVGFFKKQLNEEKDFGGLLDEIGRRINYNTYITVLLANLVVEDPFMKKRRSFKAYWMK